MLAYVINLDTATDRWLHMVAAFEATDIRLVRIAAVEGRSMELDAAHFDRPRYRSRHGREINLFEVACYLSHIKALTAFLAEESGEENAIILEDDVTPLPGFDSVARDALKFAGAWSILRLSGLSRGKPMRVEKLSGAHSLCVNLGRLKGAGAYMINRAAARSLVDHLLPISLPYDHAMDREWLWGLKAAYVLPFPISQTDRLFRSSIQQNSQRKLGSLSRIFRTYPYQVFNEFSRYIFRLFLFAAWNIRSPKAVNADKNDAR